MPDAEQDQLTSVTLNFFFFLFYTGFSINLQIHICKWWVIYLPVHIYMVKCSHSYSIEIQIKQKIIYTVYIYNFFYKNAIICSGV